MLFPDLFLPRKKLTKLGSMWMLWPSISFYFLSRTECQGPISGSVQASVTSPFPGRPWNTYFPHMAVIIIWVFGEEKPVLLESFPTLSNGNYAPSVVNTQHPFCFVQDIACAKHTLYHYSAVQPSPHSLPVLHLKCLLLPVSMYYFILLENLREPGTMSAFFQLKAEHPGAIWHTVGVPRKCAKWKDHQLPFLSHQDRLSQQKPPWHKQLEAEDTMAAPWQLLLSVVLVENLPWASSARTWKLLCAQQPALHFLSGALPLLFFLGISLP